MKLKEFDRLLVHYIPFTITILLSHIVFHWAWWTFLITIPLLIDVIKTIRSLGIEIEENEEKKNDRNFKLKSDHRENQLEYKNKIVTLSKAASHTTSEHISVQTPDSSIFHISSD